MRQRRLWLAADSAVRVIDPRPGIRSGDKLVVWRLDRLGRTTHRLVGLLVASLIADAQERIGAGLQAAYTAVEGESRPNEQVDLLLALRRKERELQRGRP